jgi:hypothetical protein
MLRGVRLWSVREKIESFHREEGQRYRQKRRINRPRATLVEPWYAAGHSCSVVEA